MSDTGRKDFSSKAKEEMTPDSQKSTTDKVSEGATDMGDKAARAVGGDSDKSTSQSAADTVSGNTDEAKGDTLMGKAKGALGMEK